MGQRRGVKRTTNNRARPILLANKKLHQHGASGKRRWSSFTPLTNSGAVRLGMAEFLQAAAEGRFDDAEGSSTETMWAASYDEPHDDDDDDDAAYDEAADAMEAAAMGERFGSAVRLAPTTKSHAASNAAEGAERKANKAKNTGLTRDERATTEQVLDPRTRLLLFKLLNAGTLSSINGCVSTGKEANVYHAEGKDGEYAIKVYKTSILIFKDRDRYNHTPASDLLSEPGPLTLSLSLT